MTKYFEEDIERVTEQTIEQKVRDNIEAIKNDTIDKIEYIESVTIQGSEDFDGINGIKNYAIDKDGNGGKINEIKQDALTHINNQKKELAEFGNSSKKEANEIYNEVCVINAATDSIVENTVSEIEYNIKEMLVDNGYIIKVFYDDNGDVSLALEIFDGIHYVSFGDSIAAGHLINNDWNNAPYYGHLSQYGQTLPNASKPNDTTLIVEDTYTDLTHKYLENDYGVGNVETISFARSGSRVKKPNSEYQSLTEIMNHEGVKDALSKADIVTICIGANDILEPATGKYLTPYLTEGIDLAPLEAEVEDSLRILYDDNHDYSYKVLFDKINNLVNPEAKVVFTTIYNPLKYLHLQKGSWDNEYQDSFFAPLLNSIPQVTVLGYELDMELKKGLLTTPAFERLFSRINVLGAWAEKYIDTNGTSVNGEKWIGLNNVIRQKVVEYQKTNPNFLVAETKNLFDSVPDREEKCSLHYNDLVNTQVTKGYNANDLEWSNLWEEKYGLGAEARKSYWTDLITKYFNISSLSFDYNGLADEIMPDVLMKVLYPAVDVHPRKDGHYVMMRSFADSLGWKSLDRYSITYNANGGNNYMNVQEVLGVDSIPAFIKLNANAFSPQQGYYFTGWNTKPDGSGTSYSNNQLISITSNLVLYAQWSNIYTVRYVHTNQTNSMSNSETGHKECYALWIDGAEMPKFGSFDSGSTTEYRLAYGTPVGVIAKHYKPSGLEGLAYGDVNCRVLWNDNVVSSGTGQATYDFTVTGNLTIDFRWKLDISTGKIKDWEDCHITTW